MNLDTAFSISGVAAEIEQAKFFSFSVNLANMNFLGARSDVPGVQHVTSNYDFLDVYRALTDKNMSEPVPAQLGDNAYSVNEKSNVKAVHSPQNPLADENGDVFTPDTDYVEQMTSMIVAMHSYKANIKSLQLSMEMNRSALELGR